MENFEILDRDASLFTISVLRWADGRVLRVSEIVNDYELMHLFPDEV